MGRVRGVACPPVDAACRPSPASIATAFHGVFRSRREGHPALPATLHELTDCHVGLGNPGPARDFLLEGVRLCRDSGAKGFLVMFLGSMAGVAMAERKGWKSVRLISAWSELAGVPDSWPSLPVFRKSSGLDDAACDAEVAIGRAMSLEEALALGMSEE